MRKLPLATLILDHDLYPRTEINTTNVNYLRDAFVSGVKLPPVIIDKKSKIVIDGFHRVTMYRKINDKMEIDVIEKSYKSKADMFRDAMRANSRHGVNLTRFDRTRCVLLGEQLNLTLDQIAADLAMTIDAVGALKTDRVGNLKTNGGIKIPLKKSILHMSGQTLTQQQYEANRHLSGMSAMFHVNQLILLIENDLLDSADTGLLNRLDYLCNLLNNAQLHPTQ